MSKTNMEHSLQVYQYVCSIIGTEKVVKTRRKIFCALDIASDRSNMYKSFSSGSKAEGLDLEGSDYDRMTVMGNFPVYENIDKVSSLRKHIPLIIDISDSKPGFAMLKLYNISDLDKHPIIKQWIEMKEGDAYFSSKLFREFLLTDNMIIHGPCQSFPKRKAYFDFAKTFRCSKWIGPARQWINRSRSSYPDKKIVTSIVQYGTLFVPIGCKGSLHEQSEWRISFSVAEKQLIFSFTHTYLLCYALMKIILKDIIGKKHSDLICSYFLKTIMFWLYEESSPLTRNPQNMITCLRNCLKRLIYCVEYKTCLHYFIPENNFFEGRFNVSQHMALLETLHDIYKSLWTYIFYTDTFQHFGALQRISSSPLRVSVLSCLTYTTCLLNPLCCTNIKLTIHRLLNIKDKELFSYLLSFVSNDWMQLSNCYKLTERNKSVYKQYQIRLRCFKEGLFHDATSGWSLLASLFYKFKRFKECLDILNYCLSKCCPDRIMTFLANDLLEQTAFQKSIETVGLLLTCKHLIVESVKFTEPFCLLPLELTDLIQNGYGIALLIPPVVYFNVLSFLCLHHLGEKKGKLNAFRDLELTVNENYFISRRDLKIAKESIRVAKRML